jgi:hypothetical protein
VILLCYVQVRGVSRSRVKGACAPRARRGAQYGVSVVGHHESFFSTSAGASAAILGLLVVAVSVVNADDADPTTRELRTVLAGSAFVVLVDIFFVSIVALTGGSAVFGPQRSCWASSS